MLCGGGALSACQPDSGEPAASHPWRAPAKAPVVAKSGTTAAEQTGGMVERRFRANLRVPGELK